MQYFSLGCDGVIDKSTQDLWSTAKDCALGGYKAIFDANGVATLRESYNHLKPGGRLVSYGMFKRLFIFAQFPLSRIYRCFKEYVAEFEFSVYM